MPKRAEMNIQPEKGDTMFKSYHCVVSGKVTGVFFRAWVNDQAASLGLKGWARNLDENKVEVLLQGDEAQVEEMRKRLLAGSPLSTIEDVKCDWIDYEKKYDSFEIR